jgi:predicted PhzF superfamily epimerase YddE/YHI9
VFSVEPGGKAREAIWRRTSSITLCTRAFFSDAFGTIVADPVCGSLNASVAQWLIDRQIVTAPYDVTQGSSLGRNVRIRITQDNAGQVRVGGSTTRCFPASLKSAAGAPSSLDRPIDAAH